MSSSPSPRAAVRFGDLITGERGQKFIAVVVASLLVTRGGDGRPGAAQHRHGQRQVRSVGHCWRRNRVARRGWDVDHRPHRTDVDNNTRRLDHGTGRGLSAGRAGSTRNSLTTLGSAKVPDFGLKTQGVTAKEVKIGLSYNVAACGDAGTLTAALGAATTGDPKKAIEAFTRHINETGGIGGRNLKSVVVDDGGAGCPEKNTAAA